MNGDKSGESRVFLFSRCVPDGRRSFPTNENSNFYHPGHWHPLAMDFTHYQSPKLLGSSPLSQINNNHNQENLGQTSGVYPIYLQNLGWSEKSKIPIVWDFPNIWKPGFTKTLQREGYQLVSYYSDFVIGRNWPMNHERHFWDLWWLKNSRTCYIEHSREKIVLKQNYSSSTQ